MSPNPLNALTLPLHGSRLIEASAGTGKTWTIAALYVRLVLGHGATDDGGSTAPPRPLLPGEILVMTFTRAATRELSGRIRERLDEAARCFRGDLPLTEVDPFLRDLHAAYPDATVRREAAYRLALAAEAMDDAAVHTIDAWCQRMLREHAFDSANLFDEELEADEAERRQQATRDYWRSEVYPLAGPVLDAVLAQWTGAQVLADQVAPLLPRQELLPAQAPITLGDWCAQVLQQRNAELAALKAGWVERADRMQAWIGHHRGGKNPALGGTYLKSNNVSAWFDALRAWAADASAEALDLGKTAPTRLTPAGIAACFNDGRQGPIPEDFGAFERLIRDVAARTPLSAALLTHAAQGIAQRLAALKRRAGRFGFADLQTRLDAALHAPHGERLRERIRAQFPVALVDEFQDTSPLQYRLFNRLYDAAANDPRTALLLIGDPKQAIYGFRGADIYSYLSARADTAGRHYVLDTNFRSTQALVAAVNTVFWQADCRDPADPPGQHPQRQGAFALGLSGDRALPFQRVKAQGRTEVLTRAAGPLPAMTLQFLPTPAKSNELLKALAEHAAAAIVDLLNDPRCGFAGPGAPPAALRRVAPGDIAVLVRNRFEATAIRRALRQRRVASVYLSDQDSVFASAEATDLLRWLQAVAAPRDTRLARDAYAGATFDLSVNELAAHVHDDTVWDQRLALLQRLHSLWQRQGVLSVIRATLHALQLPARWLAVDEETADEVAAPSARDTGERRLTNVLHLGELLQAASAQVAGEQGLIRWLAEQVAGQGGAGDERIVRLESDAQLVQVVTVHKSKGLEYPLVFLPFAHAARPVTRKMRQFIEWVDDAGDRALDFALEDAHMASADHERLREELRLFYVALTRARHALWLGVGVQGKVGGKASRLAQSALGHLLGVMPDTPCDAVEALLQPWLAPQDDGSTPVALQRLDGAPSRRRWAGPGERAPLVDAPVYRADFERRWSIASFSGLVRGMGEAGGLAATASVDRSAEADALTTASLGIALSGARDEQMREELRALPAESAASATAVDDPTAMRHHFPRGALPGNFLHELLQWLAEEGWPALDEPRIQRGLQRRCERAGHGERTAGVSAWLTALLATPLPPLNAPLGDVTALLPEMEFWMPVGRLDSAALDALSRQHLWPGQDRPVLTERTLHGLLMGFADLVFEHGGRYWVLDHKSNHLGADDAAYTDAALQSAMLAHRYDLQAMLYQLALHRLLRQRLGESYRPAQHLGGAVYLFLRGHAGPAAGCVHLPADVAWLDALDRLLQTPPPAPETPS